MPRPVVWSIAGNDSGGGAGLSADQRAAEAFGVHLCPIVAAVTAQNSVAVERVEPLPVEWLDAQLAALGSDLRPAAVKTGLLGGAAQVRCVARWIDRLRAAGPVALVVDPVLGASTGAGFADAATLAAYRDELLPRASFATPNRREAQRLLGERGDGADVPALARALVGLGAEAVCVTGGDSAPLHGRALDWLLSPQASGWLASPRIDTPHSHGTGCTFATSAAAALALGFVAADAAVLAKMATAGALADAYAAGQGAGPVRAQAGFALAAGRLPMLSWGETLAFESRRYSSERKLGLYAIVDSADRVEAVLAAGVRTIQLRIKAPLAADAAWNDALREEVARSAAACREAGAELFVNDHWALAIELGAGGVHLGQEDLLALGDDGRTRLAASGLALGISSHSLWELARAAALSPRYIACGPVWPTLTKAMPWLPQGLDNLAWWCRVAPAPVVAIGGILDADRVHAAATCGADGVCVVRALGVDPARTIPGLAAALVNGDSGTAAEPDVGAPKRGTPPALVPSMPHPTLSGWPPKRQ